MNILCAPVQAKYKVFGTEVYDLVDTFWVHLRFTQAKLLIIKREIIISSDYEVIAQEYRLKVQSMAIKQHFLLVRCP